MSDWPIIRNAFVDMTRELLTLRLAGEMDALDEQIVRICEQYPMTAGTAIIAHLVEALSATWDSLEDFSAHLIAVDAARFDNDDETGCGE